MKRRDLVFGASTLALSVAYYAMAARIPESRLADAIGPQGLPKAYALLLAALSVLLIGGAASAKATASLAGARVSEGRRAGRAGGAGGAGRVSPRSRARTWLGMLAIGVAYLVVVPWLGYVLSLAGLIGATASLQGGGLDRRAIAVAIGGAIVCWLLFVVLMRSPQPAGFWLSLP